MSFLSTILEIKGYRVLYLGMLISFIIALGYYFILGSILALVGIIMLWFIVNLIQAMPKQGSHIGKYITTIIIIGIIIYGSIATGDYYLFSNNGIWRENIPEFFKPFQEFLKTLAETDSKNSEINVFYGRVFVLLLGIGFMNILFSHDTIRTIAMIHEKTVSLFGEKIDECYFNEKIAFLNKKKEAERKDHSLKILKLDHEIMMYEGSKKIYQEEMKNK